MLLTYTAMPGCVLLAQQVQLLAVWNVVRTKKTGYDNIWHVFYSASAARDHNRWGPIKSRRHIRLLRHLNTNDLCISRKTSLIRTAVSRSAGGVECLLVQIVPRT